MNVGVVANGNGGHNLADVGAVLHDGVAFSHRFDGDFVANRNGGVGLDGDGAVVIQDQGGHVLACLNTFNNDDSHAVFFFVQYAMDH